MLHGPIYCATSCINAAFRTIACANSYWYSSGFVITTCASHWILNEIAHFMKNHKVGSGRSEISTTHLVILIWFCARFVSRIMRDVVKVEQDYTFCFLLPILVAVFSQLFRYEYSFCCKKLCLNATKSICRYSKEALNGLWNFS